MSFCRKRLSRSPLESVNGLHAFKNSRFKRRALACSLKARLTTGLARMHRTTVVGSMIVETARALWECNHLIEGRQAGACLSKKKKKTSWIGKGKEEWGACSVTTIFQKVL